MGFIARALAIVAALAAGAMFALYGTPDWLVSLLPRKQMVGGLRADPRVATFQYPALPPPRTDLERLIEQKLKDVRSEDPAHDVLRRSAVRAAINYRYAPCDDDTRRRLVEAVADYVRAYQQMRGCTYFCWLFGTEAADKAFTTSGFDRLVTDSIRSAYERGGFSAADFPRSMAADLARVARLRETEPRVCMTTPPPLPYVPRR